MLFIIIVAVAKHLYEVTLSELWNVGWRFYIDFALPVLFSPPEEVYLCRAAIPPPPAPEALHLCNTHNRKNHLQEETRGKKEPAGVVTAKYTRTLRDQGISHKNLKFYEPQHLVFWIFKLFLSEDMLRKLGYVKCPEVDKKHQGSSFG